MVFKPQSTDDIYTELKNRLTDRIDVLTNFAPTSFNYLWLRDTFAGYIREFEIAALAVQLSGWVDYAGKQLTEEDLAALGVQDVDPEEVNKYMKDIHLDELAKEVGVKRNPGEKAEGTLTINTSADTVTISAGTEFGTQPESGGSYLSYYTTEDVTPDSGTTTVDAPIIAGSIGTEYNVGGGANPNTASITYLPSAPNGVESVYNATATEGGVDRESNESLRRSVKDAIFENSGGGTRKGLKGYIETNVEGVNSVSVEEFTDISPPYVDVIVEGGADADVDDAIEHARPLGISHNRVRPTEYDVNVEVVVSGGSIDIAAVENAVTTYVSRRPLGGNVVRDKLIQTVMNADEDIELIDTLHVEVSEETHTYEDADGDGTVDTVYTLNKGSQMETDGIVGVTGVLNGSSATFTEGTDFEENGAGDGIDWSVGGDSPDTGTDFYVTYRMESDLAIEAREKSTPENIKVTE